MDGVQRNPDATGPAWLRRFRIPAHAGAPVEPEQWRHVSRWSAAGDARLDVWRHVESDNVRFEAFGPPALIAAADWVAARTRAGEIAWPDGIAGRAIMDALDLPAEAAGLAVLVEDAFRAAHREASDDGTADRLQ